MNKLTPWIILTALLAACGGTDEADVVDDSQAITEEVVDEGAERMMEAEQAGEAVAEGTELATENAGMVAEEMSEEGQVLADEAVDEATERMMEAEQGAETLAEEGEVLAEEMVDEGAEQMMEAEQALTDDEESDDNGG